MLKSLVNGALGKAGFRISRTVPPAEDAPLDEGVRDFLKRMWPVATDIPMIRVGGDRDGAYVLPDDFEGIKALFSPGVDVVATFEDEMAARGITCYMADASVEAPPSNNPSFRFERKYLGLQNTDQFTTLDAWVEANEPGDHDLLAQIDIEGAEWTVLSNASDALLKRFRIMILELHSMTDLLDEWRRPTITQVIDRLLATHHLVHNHPNNWGRSVQREDVVVPDVIEVTFLRKDRAEGRGYVREFPHQLDIVNCHELPHQPLPAAWYASAS